MLNLRLSKVDAIIEEKEAELKEHRSNPRRGRGRLPMTQGEIVRRAAAVTHRAVTRREEALRVIDLNWLLWRHQSWRRRHC